jgi:hypothetical protein
MRKIRFFNWTHRIFVSSIKTNLNVTPKLKLETVGSVRGHGQSHNHCNYLYMNLSHVF